MRIELDFPPAELFPNRSRGRHWTVMHTAKTAYRQNSAWLTAQQKKDWKPRDGEIHMTVTFLMPDRRPRDVDNLLAAAKAGIDGLADALGINDRQFGRITVIRKPGTKPGKTIIELE